MYSLSDYDYALPADCIAQKPATRRDQSRLMTFHRGSGKIEHRRFDELPRLLRPDDLLVVNDTAVIPARLNGRKASGGKVEVLLLEYVDRSVSDNSNPIPLPCLIKASKHPRSGTQLIFSKGVTANVTGFKDGIFKADFIFPQGIDRALNEIGTVPLPPYIQRNGSHSSNQDSSAYQTVYAKFKGAVAAPTAGLHFTPDLLQRLKAVGVEIAPLTLHVGYGTFSPVRVNDIREHSIHTESYRISNKSARSINQAKNDGRRVIAIGTTSCRTLESAADETGRLSPGTGWCNLYIYPGYRFKMIDGLITNFHLPQSTLLILVAALAGREQILSAYREAIENKYRFYSYGDAMLIE